LQKNRPFLAIFSPLHRSHRFAGNSSLNCLLPLAVFVLLASHPGHSQELQAAQAIDTPQVSVAEPPSGPSAEPSLALATEIPTESSSAATIEIALDSKPLADPQAAAIATIPAKVPVESEIIWEGMASYGNYNLFAIEDMTKLYTSGIEYDRHTWGYFLRAQMDYVGEVLPFVLLVEPAVSDYYGNPLSHNRKLVPGLAITPIGLRMMWRSDKQRFKPYILIKGGMIGFTQKALSKEASYEDFTLQSGFGVQTRLTDRFDLRLGLWGDFHFSNAYVVPSDPGTDVMNASWGICYHLGKPRK
jgi:hypothetical protein